jgi:hypothetical protein
MYVVIESIILFLCVYFGIAYGKVSSKLLIKKLFIFVLLSAASLAIQLTYNTILKINIPFSKLIYRAFITGLIGVFGYSIMVDLINENYLPFFKKEMINSNISMEGLTVAVSSVGAVLLSRLLQLAIEANYLQLN